MKKVILSLAFLLMVFFATAHALWIETASTGNKNKQHQVRVSLGEFGENERDPVMKWFSNLKDIELYVTDPAGNKQKVSLRDEGNHYAAEFTPSTEGDHTL